MEEENPSRPLDRISTLWSVVCQARGGEPDAANAREQLLLRYSGAVRRYLLGAVRDPDTADDLFQEFSLRLMRGDLDRADPQRGRFRHFVKGVLFHLIADHHRQRARASPLPPDALPLATVEAPVEGADREFLRGWRDELLGRAWTALEQVERRTGQPFHVVLRLRADCPDLDSAQMAQKLTASLGKPVTAAWVRQNLHRARGKFIELLVAEVAETLDQPSPDDLERELIDLDLFEYCRPAVRRGRTP
jgi:RNA polymerase sigma-70 factor (ECF subfamily)